nr:hypothetical protein [Acidaminococcus fermentans]
MLYGFLKAMSRFLSLLPYKFVVRLGRNCGKLYWHIAKKQRVRAEQTIQERMGVTARDAREIIHRLFLNLGMTAMEILYMPALNKDNIRGLVSFDRPDILWEALAKKRGRGDAGLPHGQLGMAGSGPGPQRLSPQCSGKAPAQSGVQRFSQ